MVLVNRNHTFEAESLLKTLPSLTYALSTWAVIVPSAPLSMLIVAWRQMDREAAPRF